MLLNLSGELRNKIYGYCIEAATQDLALRAPPTEVCFGGGNRQFAALAHSCRKIRAEFQPLYLRHNQVRMRFLGLNQYLETFYPKFWTGSCCSYELLALQGNIAIDIRHVNKTTEVDLLPLLGLYTHATELKCTFTCSGAGAVWDEEQLRDLNNILTVRENSLANYHFSVFTSLTPNTWTCRFSKLLLTLKHNVLIESELTLRIVFSKSYSMGNARLESFLQKVGLDDRHRLKVIVENYEHKYLEGLLYPPFQSME
ncbi:hypothetical protein BDV95DRAFT_46827 [Massariosphaeria phaeospora]|uniref:F-box domain-containing protein n=1 Tax=Massariosphaeria phaeospora TaxID=100035 RepID=A0A7C8M631_9PLEO|nr:hypothetical protein BDV95DRAFT_46827 [Massariosphaeria phaeospora]